MTVTIHEAREKLGRDIWAKAEAFANNMKKEEKPFYIVYACKEDKAESQRLGTGIFRQAFKAYYQKPPAIIGILVWYVDNRTGEFTFKPELSVPPDVPIDPRLLSTDSADFSPEVAAQGEKMNVLLS